MKIMDNGFVNMKTNLLRDQALVIMVKDQVKAWK